MSLSGVQDKEKDQSLIEVERSDLPEPSHVSLSRSMNPPYNLRDKDDSTDLSLIQVERSDSSEPSHVSLSRSMNPPYNLRDRDDSTDLRTQKEESRIIIRRQLLIKVSV
ncbi:hypothetical protein AMELA_G00087220 [Ameiurus melas]|uniref:Uncharacterized protein n=1 Tax=Ameiurus melas TaxID=219545 RepID=A0A7J6AV24_AMEME|nr:hypothetical protein AMELA_G00087220 [Ameiurus melas]